MSGQQLNWIQHGLLRPEVNIGVNENFIHNVFTFEGNKIVLKEMTFNPAFNRIFVEIMSNAIDNLWRSQEIGVEMKNIKIWVDNEKVTIQNDGKHIPIEKHRYKYDDTITGKTITRELYPAQLFFGEWLSGTNYDDDKARKTSGKNGIGAKATNIFSKKMEIEHTDTVNKKKLTIVYEKNRSVAHDPVVESYRNKTSYTKITYYPDLKRFGIAEINEDWINLFKKYTYDCAMVTGINVTFNDKKVVNVGKMTLKKYSSFYNSSAKSLEMNLSEISVVIQQNVEDDEIKHVSFVNGIYTKNGGKYVEKVKNAIVDGIRLKINPKKAKELDFTRKEIEVYTRLFIRYECDKPDFDSQSKHSLVKPTPNFTKDDKIIIGEIINKMMKWEFIKLLKEKKINKETSKLKNKDSKRRTVLALGNKLDDANWAKVSGKSMECVLMVTEGDSAKALVLTGRGSVKDGHNKYGAYALKGKIINAGKVSALKLNENEEVSNLKKAIGLRYGEKYETIDDLKKLRYGKVAILCDQDSDGHHIGGLLLELFYKEYPQLIKNGFIGIVNTPIIRAKWNRKSYEFFTYLTFEEFSLNKKGISAAYYKGLGTHEPSECKEIFKNLKIVNVESDGTDEEKNTMKLGFEGGKKHTDDRKEWLKKYTKDTQRKIDESIEDGKLSVSDFVNYKLIQFSEDDVKRSIPSIIDGLKPSQRKILYTLFKKGINKKEKKAKVSQFAGTVIKTADYHHGDSSLHGAIIGMAQNFVGSNNINLLYPSGGFGTRLGEVKTKTEKGVKKHTVKIGDDSAAPRYIFTYLNEIAYSIFDSRDNILYNYNKSDEGVNIEPEYYVPIIPMVLVNGSKGIGSGWSSTINCYDPLDLVDWIYAWLDKDELFELIPWYKNWKGERTKVTQNGKIVRVNTIGILTEHVMEKTISRNCKKGSKYYSVTELPIGMPTRKFKLFLESMETEGNLTFEEYNDEEKVEFIIYPKDGFTPSIETNFKILKGKLHTTNMVGLNRNMEPTKYETAEDIMEEFCEVRLEMYKYRRENIIKTLSKDLLILDNRYRFIDMIINKRTITIFNKTIKELDEDLEKNEFTKIDDSFKYLTSMKFSTCTKDKLAKLTKKIQDTKSEIEYYNKTNANEMWKKDLEVFEIKYEAFLKK